VTKDRDSAGRGDSAGQRDSSGDETLPEAFWSVARQLRETSQETLAPWDINPSHLRALRMLSRHGAMRLSELSDHLRIAARSATEVIDALESRGLAGRRPDPGDRRATLVELTEHGAEVLEAIRAARGSETERVFGRLSRADRDHLARILRMLQNP
jgi:DNA-binding MarR family transcriptional regulator